MGNYRPSLPSLLWKMEGEIAPSTGCLLMALVTLSFLVMTASLPPQFINVDF